jgi:solute carrier family 25 citrate transporter 1
VLTGIVPKMAIRFTSYEWYKQLLADPKGNVSGQSTFLGTYTSSSPRCNFGIVVPLAILTLRES